MVWTEWGIGQSLYREQQNWSEGRGRKRAERLEELRQLRHEDRRASELDSAETIVQMP